jgi:hypothetical protein
MAKIEKAIPSVADDLPYTQFNLRSHHFFTARQGSMWDRIARVERIPQYDIIDDIMDRYVTDPTARL